MPRGKGLQRTPAQKDADLATISKLMAIGYTPRAILDRINSERSNKLCLRTIQFDIVRARRHWLETVEHNMEQVIQRELCLMDYISTEAMDAWEESKKSRTPRSGNLSKRRFGIFDASSEFLRVAIKCSEERRKLLGIDRADDRTRYLAGKDDPTKRPQKMILEIAPLPDEQDVETAVVPGPHLQLAEVSHKGS